VLPLIVSLTIILIAFISAATFSLSDILNTIDEETLITLFVFIVSFALIFFALSKAFKTNNTIAAIISFASSFLITYWVNKSGFDLGSWIYDIGISEEILYLLIPILAIAFAIFLVIRLRKKSLFVFGGLFLLSSFFVYEKTIMIVIGVVLLLVGFLWRGRNGSKDDPVNYLKRLFTPSKKRR